MGTKNSEVRAKIVCCSLFLLLSCWFTVASSCLGCLTKKIAEDAVEHDEPHYLQVSYGDDEAMNWNENKTPIVIVQKKKVDEQKYYSLLMIDPDAPSRDDPEFADWLHWGVYNIPGDVFVHGALDVDEHAAHGFKLF